jgi:transposase InsO family protein
MRTAFFEQQTQVGFRDRNQPIQTLAPVLSIYSDEDPGWTLRMGSVPSALAFLLMIFAGWVNRHQLIVIEFLQAENRLLKERLRGRRIRFTDAEWALLARKAKAIGRKALLELDTIVSPDTLLRWHRQLIAQKWKFNHRRHPGRPGVMRQISDLIVRMAQDNPGWGYTRIQGALANLSHRVGRGTVANVLKRNGIEPAPERGKRTVWSTLLKAHWKVLAASDFLTVEVWTARGLVTHYLLFVISLVDRTVHNVGITVQPNEPWMLQAARNPIDTECGALLATQYLITDRDIKYTEAFRRLISDGGTQVIRLPPRSPNLNAYAERFVRSIKKECLNRMTFVGQTSLRRAVVDYLEHYHAERNHQGLGNRLIRSTPSAAANNGMVRRRQRLGGMLNFYYREAA